MLRSLLAGNGKPRLRSTKWLVGCSTKKSSAGSTQEEQNYRVVRNGRFWSGRWMVAEVTRMEEECYKLKAVSQGSWTTWEGANLCCSLCNASPAHLVRLQGSTFTGGLQMVLRKLAQVLEGQRQESRCSPPHPVCQGGRWKKMHQAKRHIKALYLRSGVKYES